MATTTSTTTETQAFVQLRNDLQSVDEILSTFSDEATLFQRTMYKNQSQHRRAFFFQNLQQVKRCLRDIQLPTIRALFQDVERLLTQLEVPPGMHHVAWKVLASDVKLQTDAVLRKLAHTAANAAELRKRLAAQFAMTYFMPFALFMNSVVARLVLLARALLTRAIEAHGAMALLYLHEVTKANPLRAPTTALQLRSYAIAPAVLAVANVGSFD